MIDFSKGLKFECQQCGYCCRFEPGFVFLTERDLIGLTEYFSLSQKDFIENHCRVISMNDHQVLSLKEKSNHDCVFWNEGCTIYEARPSQCRTYPFWPSVLDSQNSWNDEAKYCPGINKGPLKPESDIASCLEDKTESLFLVD